MHFQTGVKGTLLRTADTRETGDAKGFRKPRCAETPLVRCSASCSYVHVFLTSRLSLSTLPGFGTIVRSSWRGGNHLVVLAKTRRFRNPSNIAEADGVQKRGIERHTEHAMRRWSILLNRINLCPSLHSMLLLLVLLSVVSSGPKKKETEVRLSCLQRSIFVHCCSIYPIGIGRMNHGPESSTLAF